MMQLRMRIEEPDGETVAVGPPGRTLLVVPPPGLAIQALGEPCPACGAAPGRACGVTSEGIRFVFPGGFHVEREAHSPEPARPTAPTPEPGRTRLAHFPILMVGFLLALLLRWLWITEPATLAP